MLLLPWFPDAMQPRATRVRKRCRCCGMQIATVCACWIHRRRRCSVRVKREVPSAEAAKQLIIVLISVVNHCRRLLLLLGLQALLLVVLLRTLLRLWLLPLFLLNYRGRRQVWQRRRRGFGRLHGQRRW